MTSFHSGPFGPSVGLSSGLWDQTSTRSQGFRCGPAARLGRRRVHMRLSGPYDAGLFPNDAAQRPTEYH